MVLDIQGFQPTATIYHYSAISPLLTSLIRSYYSSESGSGDRVAACLGIRKVPSVLEQDTEPS